MKDYLKILCIGLLFLVAGIGMSECRHGGVKEFNEEEECVAEREVVYDTVRYGAPSPVSSTLAGYREIRIPVMNFLSKPDSFPTLTLDRDSMSIVAESMTGVDEDSIQLRLPIVSNVYESDEYRAYVSGVCAELDSIFVFPRREIVTIKKPPKHWHVGPTVGYGYTSEGFGAFVGFSITYSLISF